MPEPAVHELPMRWADLDSLNHVNNVVYLDYAAESRAMLVEEGMVGADEPVARIAVDFLRPLLLSTRPVQVVSTRHADEITQEIRSKGSEIVCARVTATLGGGPRTIATRAGVGDPLPARVRRSDLDPAGEVTSTKMFELFQECRILFVSSRLPAMTAGRFVVGRVDVTYGTPMAWRAEPYEARSWISRVGGSSMTIESQILDGEIVLAQCLTVLVGFDLETQRSRAFTDEERAELGSLTPPG